MRKTTPRKSDTLDITKFEFLTENLFFALLKRAKSSLALKCILFHFGIC